MNRFKQIFPYIIFLSAVAISFSAAYYSVFGLSKLFAGAKIQVIIMATSLEFAKLVIATGFHLYWQTVVGWLRYYLVCALVILIILTSAGIYGFLSDAYKQTADKDRITETRINLIRTKKDIFTANQNGFKKEKDELNLSISKLRGSLATDNQYQTVVRGQVITQIQSTPKKAVNEQLNISNRQLVKLDSTISALGDSIMALELRIIDTESKETVSELGPLKYLSSLTGVSMDRVINWFLILIMVVFDPLAIALILFALFAFGRIKEEPTKEVLLPEVTEKVKRKYNRKPKINELDNANDGNAETVVNVSTDQNNPTEIATILEIKPKRKRRTKKEMEQARKFNIDVPDLTPVELSLDSSVNTAENIIVAQNANDSEIKPVELTKVQTRPKRKRKNVVVETSLTTPVQDHLKDAISAANDDNKKKV